MPLPKGQQMRRKCRTNAVWMHPALLFHSNLMYFGLWPCPSCSSRVLRRQVKGARWQNAWCVAYFLGFDLPQIHSFEENEDELQQRGHPLSGERTYQQMDNKSVFLTLLFRLPLSLPCVPFYFFCTSLSLTVMECLGSAEGSQGGSGQAADCHNRPLTNKTEENGLHF